MGRKLWRIWRIATIRQVFFANIPNEARKCRQALDSPKFFPPVFQNHNFAKFFYRQSFVLYGIYYKSLLQQLHSLGACFYALYSASNQLSAVLFLCTALWRGSTALWFEHWPGDRKVPGSMPSSVSCCCFLEQGTLLSLLQSTQLYKWVILSHRYCKEFGDFSRRSSTRFGETSLGRFITVKKCKDSA